MTPLILAALAVLLAGPVPLLVARAPGLRRTPMAALVLWQAMALAAVLAALGAGAATVTGLAIGERVSALEMTGALAAAAVTVVVLARLVVVGHRVGTRLRAHRRDHRRALDLVAVREGREFEVLDHPLPVAYCLPAMRASRVVLSAGAVDRLTDAQIAAVVAHERAHLRSRHDLLLEAFTVLHEAFPAWVASATARREVSLLVEVLADRAAARATSARALGEALLAVATGRVPAGSMALIGAPGQLVVRAQLLGDCDSHRVQSLAVLVASAALVLVPTLTVAVPWLRSLA